MTTTGSQITSLTVVYWTVYSDADKKNIKAPRRWPLCGEFTGTGEFLAQRASYAENVSIWWRHHGITAIEGPPLIITVIMHQKDDKIIKLAVCTDFLSWLRISYQVIIYNFKWFINHFILIHWLTKLIDQWTKWGSDPEKDTRIQFQNFYVQTFCS